MKGSAAGSRHNSPRPAKRKLGKSSTGCKNYHHSRHHISSHLSPPSRWYYFNANDQSEHPYDSVEGSRLNDKTAQYPHPVPHDQATRGIIQHLGPSCIRGSARTEEKPQEAKKGKNHCERSGVHLLRKVLPSASTAVPVSSKPRSTATSSIRTSLRSHSSGTRPPIKSWRASPDLVSELLTHVTSRVLWYQRERRGECRAIQSEVAPVIGEDCGDLMLLAQRQAGRIHEPEVGVGISPIDLPRKL